ncbi:hypothetical protein DRE_00889 [Drechslerella stenobrocha 248]|uniref:F-box domain-containing protein n=1 Tax=Drechslerella stenobrocha 248 TaxID=1043628 RepID=W7I911_9PEZI|nr:hypothetical protein DRE_00889 [Drechslerella stenobrocha 248]
MPSAPSTTASQTGPPQSSPPLSITSQHGLHHSNRPPSSSPESDGHPPGEPTFGEPVFDKHSFAGTGASGPTAQSLLNCPSTGIKDKPAANKQPRSSNGASKPYIVKLPNEVLTHALSFLDPGSLTSVSFVSRRFHALVTSPHAWKDAFARYFPQHDTTAGSHTYPSNARYFTRLSEFGSHRSEYILRTQLLRSLKRGRPSLPPPTVKPGSSNFSMITYSPKLHESTITHLHANFTKNRVIAASQYTGLFSYSDPRTGYVTVDQRVHPGYSSLGLQYISPDGLGALDLSEPRGQIIGDARNHLPSFFVERASPGNLPTRFVTNHGPDASITCLWLAKKDTIVNTSASTIISASGSSKGVVQFQDAANNCFSSLVCPGIPILQIRIDDGYTKARERRDRIWCIFINAIGEVWYMKGTLPKRTIPHTSSQANPTSHSPIPWHYIPSTRKHNSPLGIDTLAFIGATPTIEQIQEQEAYMHMEPEMMAAIYSEAWRLDYFLEADFGGQNFIIGCEGGEDALSPNKRRANMSRYSRILDNVREDAISEVFIKTIYRHGYHEQVEEVVARPPDEVDPPDQWHHTQFTIPRNAHKEYAFITAIAIDMSNLALLSPNEDPLLARLPADQPTTPQQVPGQRARLFAIGTHTGTVHIYNARHPISATSTLETALLPLHSITTASPSISSLALSSLYLVHGGTDGLVQAWDPLVSLAEPIRAIHSRFSTRARRRLAQAATSVHGIGENQFAARAIFLDPDPTSLRGIVALGTHIRSWSFGTLGEKVLENSNARRRRRNPRHNSYLALPGVGRGRTSNSSKSPLPRDILDEADRIARTRHEDTQTKHKLAERFGVGYGGMKGLTEDEMLMYAMMMSEESFEQERGLSDAFTGSSSSRDSVGLESTLEGIDVGELWTDGLEGATNGIVSSSSVPDVWSEPLELTAAQLDEAVNSSNTIDDEALAKALQSGVIHQLVGCTFQSSFRRRQWGKANKNYLMELPVPTETSNLTKI